jgi:hypothetical protein
VGDPAAQVTYTCAFHCGFRGTYGSVAAHECVCVKNAARDVAGSSTNGGGTGGADAAGDGEGGVTENGEGGVTENGEPLSDTSMWDRWRVERWYV